MAKTSPDWGGKREGAGRPRTRLIVTLTPQRLQELEGIATREGTEIQEIVDQAFVRFILDYHRAQDTKGGRE